MTTPPSLAYSHEHAARHNKKPRTTLTSRKATLITRRTTRLRLRSLTSSATGCEPWKHSPRHGLNEQVRGARIGIFSPSHLAPFRRKYESLSRGLSREARKSHGSRINGARKGARCVRRASAAQSRIAG